MRAFFLSIALGSCSCGAGAPATPDAAVPSSGPSLPMTVVADVPFAGKSTRYDYMDIDRDNGHLIVAHMNDGNVVVANLSDGAVVKVVPNVPTARGIVVAGEVGLFFVTSSPNQVVAVDGKTLTEVRRVTTGNGPDGVGWDGKDSIVATSDQSDGAISLIAGAGTGARVQLKLGTETGNVVYDAARGVFWITVVGPTNPDRLVAIDPIAQKTTITIPMQGCDGAHGLRIHPDGASAFVACENNDKLARVDLGSHAVALGSTGSGPDVLSIDAGLGWLYVAAESGDLTVFDLNQPGVALVGHDHPGSNSHTVAADPATHRVFFPLMKGPNGTPVLRIMKPQSSGS
jgi:hypothetical protein